MSDHHIKYGKEFLAKLLTVIGIPLLAYYCTKQSEPSEPNKARPPHRFVDPHEDEWKDYFDGIPTIIDRDSLQ